MRAVRWDRRAFATERSTVFRVSVLSAAPALGVARLDLIGDHVVFEHVTEFALLIAVFGAGLAVEREVSGRSKR